MNKEQVLKILDYYKSIDDDITFYRRMIRDNEEMYYNTIGGMASDGMPHGSNISKITENAALSIPCGVKENIKSCEQRIAELCELKTQTIREISKLEFKEKSVLYDFYINNLKWEQVAVRNHYSERQCRNIKDKAILKLIPKFEKNRCIAKFEIEEGF